MKKANKEKPICAHCASENVSLDAAVVFCVNSQSWVIGSIYDAAFCQDCEKEAKIRWIVVGESN